MFLQGPSTGLLQTASGGPHPLQGPPAARDFTVPRAHVFSSQPFVLPMGREFLTPPMHSEDVGDTQDGLLSSPLLDDCHHIDWPRLASGWRLPSLTTLPPMPFWLAFSCLPSNLSVKKNHASRRVLHYCLFDADFPKMHWQIHIVLAGGSCAWINTSTHGSDVVHCGCKASFLMTVDGETVRNAWLCTGDGVWYITHLYVCN